MHLRLTTLLFMSSFQTRPRTFHFRPVPPEHLRSHSSQTAVHSSSVTAFSSRTGDCIPYRSHRQPEHSTGFLCLSIIYEWNQKHTKKQPQFGNFLLQSWYDSTKTSATIHKLNPCNSHHEENSNNSFIFVSSRFSSSCLLALFINTVYVKNIWSPI